MRLYPALCLLAVVLTACEDGPQQVFQPNEADNFSQQNGYDTGSTWTQDGDKGFDTDEVAGDNAGRARFCDEALASELIQWMVTQPLIPDAAGGGIPLWSEDGGPIHVDSLLGIPNERNEDGTWDPGKFCDPWYTYSNALTWGPLDEIIVFFEPDTRLVTDVQVIGQYLGTLSGSVTQDSAPVEVSMQIFERLRVGDQELEVYPQWVSHETVTTMYGMIRETFFGDAALPEGFNCVSAKLCDIIYSLGDPALPQTTYVLFQDSGVIIGFSEDGYLQFVDIAPVRIAPFEVAASIDFGDLAAIAPSLASDNALLPDCQVNLNDTTTWAQFKLACVSEQTLNRVNYLVHTQRDAVDVEFNGVTMSFLRPTTERGVLPDGSEPGEEDELFGLAFSRSLNATVAEYVPHTIALSYKARLEARLASALSADAPDDHPFKAGNYDVFVPYADAEQTIPLLPTTPQRIGELSYEGQSWVPQVVEDVNWTYQSMSPAYQAMVNEQILNEVFLIEPFVDAVLDTLTHGASDDAGTFKAFRTTDTRMWSIGRAHFTMNGQPYRVVVQYSLYYGAVTYITVERGYSEVDTLFNKVSGWLNETYGLPTPPYYELWMSESWLTGYNPFALGGDGISVSSPDRQLDTLTVGLMDVNTFWDEEPVSSAMVVPGYPVADENGYSRQIQGERYEFVPADVVYLYGKENTLLFYVEADGTIGRVVQPTFKGDMTLCGDLTISYGDNVRNRLIAWELLDPDGYRDCEVVFNYSENGNVLDGVASLRNRVSFTTIDGRAVTAAIWR